MQQIPAGFGGEISVGPSGADVVGTTGRAIQIAVDAIAARGGGTVRVLPGEYVLADAVRLRSHIALVGDRERTILRRGPLVWSRLAVDADTGQRELTPEDASAFRPGMGVCLRDDAGGWVLSSRPYVVTGIEGGRLLLNDLMVHDRLTEAGGVVANHFPFILAVGQQGVVVDGFTLDGQVDDPDGVLADMRSSLVYLHCTPGSTVRNVMARHARGDGICFADASTGTTVEDCEACENTKYGIHPGSHSAHSAVRRCRIHHNGSDGLYVCWGIHHSEFTDNEIRHNGLTELRSGMSIGHKDADNLIARNRISENKKFGVCVRRKTAANGAHRCVYRDNVIENNGSRADELADVKSRLEPWEVVGCGVHVSGMTRDLVFEGNTIGETRRGEARTQQHALRLAEGVSGIRMVGNTITGHLGQAVLDESGSGDHELQQ